MLDPAAPSRSSWHYAWYILAVGTLVVFGALGLARFGYTMVLPAMQMALGLSNAQAGGLATANLAGYLLLAVAGGALASRHGPRSCSIVPLPAMPAPPSWCAPGGSAPLGPP